MSALRQTFAVCAFLVSILAVTNAIVYVPTTVVHGSTVAVDTNTYLRVPATSNFRRNLTINADFSGVSGTANFYYSRCFMPRVNLLQYAGRYDFQSCSTGVSCTKYFPIFNDPDEPCDTYIQITYTAPSAILNFELRTMTEAPLPFLNISIKEPQVIHTNSIESTQVSTNSISGWFFPIARVKPATFTDDFIPSVYSSSIVGASTTLFTEPPWSPTATTAPNLLLPGRTYYLYGVVNRQGAINVSTLIMPVVYTSIISSSDGPKQYWLEPYKVLHMGIEFDTPIEGTDDSYFQLNSSRPLLDQEWIGYTFGAVAWGERGGQGGGGLTANVRTMTRKNSLCSIDVHRRTYVSIYFYPRPVDDILASSNKPLAPITLEVVARPIQVLPDIRATETAVVTQRYEYNYYRMADFATAILSAGNLVFDRSQKTNGWVYFYPPKCNEQVYLAPDQPASRPSCELIGSTGALEVNMMLYDSGNITYTRTNAVQVASVGSTTRITGVVGSPVAIRGPASASSYPITYRATAVTVTAGHALYIYHWRSRGCGPTAGNRMVTFSSVGQSVDIVLNCPAQAIYFDSGSAGSTSFDIQLLSTNSFVPLNFTITPGASMNYTTRPQEVVEIKLLFTTSSAFSLVINGNASWTGEGAAAIFSGTCDTTYNACSRGSSNGAFQYKVHTYSTSNVEDRPQVTEATLQIRTRTNAPLNLQINVVYNGDALCSTDPSLVPADCAGIVDYPVPASTDFFNPGTAVTGVQNAKDFMQSTYPTDVQQNTAFYREVIRQTCLRAVPKCTAGGIDSSVASCKRNCYTSLVESAPGQAADSICQTLDASCPVYNFPRLPDPPVPPMAPPMDPPVAPPMAPPVQPPVAAPTAEAAPVQAPVSVNPAPTATAPQNAPVAANAPQSVGAAPKASSSNAPTSNNQASSGCSIALSYLMIVPALIISIAVLAL